MTATMARATAIVPKTSSGRAGSGAAGGWVGCGGRAGERPWSCRHRVRRRGVRPPGGPPAGWPRTTRRRSRPRSRRTASGDSGMCSFSRIAPSSTATNGSAVRLPGNDAASAPAAYDTCVSARLAAPSTSSDTSGTSPSARPNAAIPCSFQVPAAASTSTATTPNSAPETVPYTAALDRAGSGPEGCERRDAAHRGDDDDGDGGPGVQRVGITGIADDREEGPEPEDDPAAGHELSAPGTWPAEPARHRQRDRQRQHQQRLDQHDRSGRQRDGLQDEAERVAGDAHQPSRVRQQAEQAAGGRVGGRVLRHVLRGGMLDRGGDAVGDRRRHPARHRDQQRHAVPFILAAGTG